MRALRLSSAVSSGALLAGLMAPVAAMAAQACGSYAAGQHYFVGVGFTCTAPGGTYTPVATGTTILPFNDPGYGLVTYGGGVLTTSGAVTVNAPNASGAGAALSTGAGSAMTLTNGATLTTQGANANAVQADTGGVVTLGATGVTTTVTTTGQNGMDLYATGANSQITATNVTASFAFGGGGVGVWADQNATINVTGGAVTSTGAFIVNAAAWNGATLTLSGTTLTASGDGGNTLWASNGGQVSGTNLTIQSTGGTYNNNGQTITSGGASNNAFDSTVSGGTLKLTTSSIVATGYGVYTANGGATTLTGDAISVTGANGVGVQSGVGGATTVIGGTVATTQTNAAGLYATGAGSTITTQLLNGAGLAVTTAGSNASGALADTGGSIALNGGSVTTSGTGALGLYATGAGSQVSASGVAVSTSGNLYANAFSAENGGTILLNGGSMATSGAGSYVGGAVTGGTAQITGTTITATGLGGGGLFVNGATASITGTNLTISVKGGTDTADGINAVGADNESYLSYSGGGTLKLTNSTITTGSAGADGVYTGDSGTTTLSGVQISTSANNAYGVQTQTGASTMMTGGAINTTGVISDAVYGDGGSTTTLSGVQLTTSGNGAKGVSIHGTGTMLTGSNLTISTSGGFDSATSYNAQAIYNGSGPAPNTSANTGGGTIKLTDTTITTSGEYGYGLDTENGGSSTLTGGSIMTTGFKGDAVLAIGASTVTLSGLTLSTTGNSAKGLNVEGTGTTLTGVNLTISTAGIVDPATSYGVQGVFNGTGKNPTAQTTGGGTVTLTDSSVSTTGVGAQGVQTANNGVTNFYGGSITTGAANAIALLAQTGASVTVGLDPLGAATQISTSGQYAYGVVANGGASVNLTGTTITTSGLGAIALNESDAGSSLTATNVSVVTTGTLPAGAPNSWDAIYDGPGSGTSGGKLTLNNVTVQTGVDRGSALDVETGGVATATGGSFTDTAVSAADVLVEGGSLQISGTTLTTSGAGTTALVINGAGGQITASNLTISTSGGVDPVTGYSADGVYNGAVGSFTSGGTMNIADSSVATSGAKAYGVSAGPGGVISFLGGSVATSGAGAHALLVGGAGASLTVGLDQSGTGTTISTTGASANGATAKAGGSLTLNGTRITTFADGAAGLTVSDDGTTVTATNVMISTHGGMDTATGYYAHAIYNGPGASGTSGGSLTLNNVSASAAGFETFAMLTSTGGSSTVKGGTFSTSGENAPAMFVVNTGQLQVSGATLSTSGFGSPGLAINGSGGSVTASNLTIVTTGQISTTTGSYADGIYNGAFGAIAGGGVMKVTDSTVRTSGDHAGGVVVGPGGTTTFLGGAAATQGFDASAAQTNSGGTLNIGRDGAGLGARLTTSGNGSYAVNVSAGSIITLDGATVATTGDGSGGLTVVGAGGELDATDTTVSTTGAYDSVSNLQSYGAYNGPSGAVTTGGVLNLTNTAITTQGAAMYGVYAAASSTTTINGGSVATAGAGAHALYVSGAGAFVTANGVQLSTTGAAAFGAEVLNGASLTLGGGAAIQTTGAGSTGLDVSGAGSKATIAGDVAISVGAGALALSAENGGVIVLNGGLTLSSAGTALIVNGGAASGSISLNGPLNIATTSSAPAIQLSGDGATFDATSGGSIHAYGEALAFLNGLNQSASFVGFTIDNVSGDLIFADPTTATMNFTNTTVNAGSGNLVDATAGSALTVSASNSSLTGAVATDATSTTNFYLSNNSSLTLTGNSAITYLNLANSALSFSAPSGGAYKTLTVTNFTGTNSTVTLNATLGPGGGADQIVINGGKATGATTLAIRPVGAAGATTGLGVPVVTTANGGTIAPGAFALAAPIIYNGYLYTLQAQGSGDYLVSNTTQTPTQAASSLAALSQSRQTQTVTAKVLGSILTGATEQINCSSCQSGFASFGSFALGVHGRWTLSPSLALLAGGSYDSFSGRGVTVNNSVQAALALRYDAVSLGKYRPFVEGGVSLQPWASVTYSRSYASALGGGVGTGTALSRSVALYGRVGYIWRLTRTDEAAVYTDLTRSWDYTSGYTESATLANPNGATISPELDTLNVWRSGAQFTHLFGQHIEGNLSGGFAQAFGAAYGTSAAIGGFGVDTASAPTGFHWWELGGRVSYRFSKMVTGDLFLLGTLGAQPVGDQLHGGAALRLAF